MVDAELREYERLKAEIAVTVHKSDEKIPATMIDLSRRGFGLESEEKIVPLSKIKITLNHADSYAIYGTAQWALLRSIEKKYFYQTGIRSDEALNLEEILKTISHN